MRRCLVAAVVTCVVGAIATTGAGSASGAQTPRPVGFVYLAPLAALHPMYPDLARLDEAVRALRADQLPPEFPVLAMGGRIHGEYIAGPIVLHWPGERWLARHDDVVARLSRPIAQQASGLPPDLQARLSWETDRIRRATATQLLEAEAEASRDLARATMDTYRDNQERLLDADSGTEASSDTRQSVVDVIETDLAALESRQKTRLAELKDTLEQRQEAEIRELERDVWRAADQRLRPALGAAGRALRETMTRQMGHMTTPAWLSTVQLRLPTPALPDMARHDLAASRAISLSRQEQRDRQADALIKRRVEITKSILDAAAIAAQRIARQRGVRLYTVPADEPVGTDMTDDIAEALRQMWAGVRQPRAQEE